MFNKFWIGSFDFSHVTPLCCVMNSFVWLVYRYLWIVVVCWLLFKYILVQLYKKVEHFETYSHLKGILSLVECSSVYAKACVKRHLAHIRSIWDLKVPIVWVLELFVQPFTPLVWCSAPITSTGAFHHAVRKFVHTWLLTRAPWVYCLFDVWFADFSKVFFICRLFNIRFFCTSPGRNFWIDTVLHYGLFITR